MTARWSVSCQPLWLAAAASLACSTGSAQHFVELGRKHLPAIAGQTLTCASGDIDGDGDVDLVFGGEAPTLRLLRNDGQARFTPVPIPTNTDWVFGLVFFDADRDGDADLYAARGGYDWLLLNDGAGNFSDATTSRIPAVFDSSREVVAVDVDRDGDLDLVVANVQPMVNRLLLNDGTGYFVDAPAGQLPPAGAPSITIEAADLDGDQDIDLFFGNDGLDALLLNDGSGRFVATASVPWDRVRTDSTALADVDGDGDFDLVVAIGVGSILRLFSNDGRAGFSAAGSGRFPAIPYTSARLDAGDTDRDGDVDLVVGNAEVEPTRLLLNNGNGVFSNAMAQLPETEGQLETQAVLLRDLNGDGYLDILLGNHFPDGHDALFVNDGGRRFEEATRPVVPYHANAGIGGGAIGDVDGDGRVDIVACAGWDDHILIQRSGGYFVDRAGVAMPPRRLEAITSLVLADVDSDRDLDLVLGNFLYPKRLFLNSGVGVFTDVTSSQLNVLVDATVDVILVDVDGDHDLDLAAGVTNNGQNRLFRNDGSGRFADVTTTALPVRLGSTSAVAAGDVDGDGDADLLFGNNASSPTRSWLYVNDGTGRFTDATLQRLPGRLFYTEDLALADLDGDRDLDLVLGNVFAPIALYVNDGRGLFSDASASHLPAFPQSARRLAVADVDIDGDIDLLLADASTRLYGNDGTGHFSDDSHRLAVIRPIAGPLLGDVDDDGDVDLLDYTRPMLYANAWRQTHVPFVASVGRPLTLGFYAKAGLATAPQPILPFLSLALAPSPIALPPLGRVMLSPLGLVALPAAVASVPAGTATLVFTLPSVRALAGLPLCLQALVQHEADPATWRLTNTTVDTILR